MKLVIILEREAFCMTEALSLLGISMALKSIIGTRVHIFRQKFQILILSPMLSEIPLVDFKIVSTNIYFH